MRVQGSAYPGRIWIRNKELDYVYITLRDNVEEKQVEHEDTIDTIYEYDEVTIKIVDRPNLEEYINTYYLSIIYFISIVLPLLVTTLIFFWKKGKEIRPKLKYSNNEKSKEIIFLGSKIFINQIFYLLLTGFNSYLITYFLSSAVVVEYQIYYKIFMLTGTIFTLVLVPFFCDNKSNGEKEIQLD